MLLLLVLVGPPRGSWVVRRACTQLTGKLYGGSTTAWCWQSRRLGGSMLLGWPHGCQVGVGPPGWEGMLRGPEGDQEGG